MKNIVRNSIALIFCSGFLFLASCEKENIDETTIDTSDQAAPARIVGEWEAYKREAEELILGFEDGEMVQSMEWIDLTSSFANEGTLEFYEDHTFISFYGGVQTHEGDWIEENDSTFSFTFDEYPWSDLTETYVVNFHCDNTMSINFRVEPPAGNHDFQDANWYEESYFRIPGTIECDDLTDYYVDITECPNWQANIGDSCQDGWGTISADCDCIENENFCSVLTGSNANYPSGYIGDECWTTNDQQGFISENCECVENVSEPDCPEFFYEGWSDGNYGSPCETPDVPLGGIIGDDCECIEDENFCSVLIGGNANYPNGYIGDECWTANDQQGFISENCECIEN